MKFYRHLFLKQANEQSFCGGKGSICGCFFLCSVLCSGLFQNPSGFVKSCIFAVPHSFFKTTCGIRLPDKIGCFYSQKGTGYRPFFYVYFIFSTTPLRSKESDTFFPLNASFNFSISSTPQASANLDLETV